MTAIRISNLGKRYRLGIKEQRNDTLTGAAMAWLKAPIDNYRRLRSLHRFADRDDAADVIWALREVTATIEQGEIVGVVGRNGAGKSTLLKVLSRITEPTTGRVELLGRVSSLLEVGTGFHPDLTGRENVYLNGTILGMKKREIDRKFDEIVDFAELPQFIDTPVKRYSSGMKVRLAFSVAAHLEPEILLIDEVLAVGDVAFQRKCLGKMDDVARGGRTVLFVSHNMETIQQFCPRSLLMSGGRLVADDATENVLALYERMLTPHLEDANRPPHLLYQSNLADRNGHFAVTALELLDERRRPLTNVHTWDSFILRVHFIAPYTVRTGSVVIWFHTAYGRPLAMMSTQPDSNVEVCLEEGEGFVECRIERLPFAAGDYSIGAGLAVPKREWLFRDEHLARFEVHPRDVFGSGRAPRTKRSLLALDHQWITIPVAANIEAH